MTSFRNLALSICRTKCFSKTGAKQQYLTEKYGSFVYKGITFHYDGHVGIVPQLNVEEAAKDMELIDHLWFLYTEWDKVKPELVNQLNLCRTMADVHLLVPDDVKESLPNPILAERTLPEDFFEDFKKGTTYTMLETLIFTNEILEQ
jgi:hypothetical protein